MKMKELYHAFADGKIDKRVYWRLMRDKFSALVELRDLLGVCPNGTTVTVGSDDVVLDFQGVRLAFDFSQTFCRSEAILAMAGNPEQEDFDFLGSLIHPGDVLFDIGANVGVVSLLMLQENPHIGKIYAFEPLPQTFTRLKRNLELNGSPEKIATFNLGLSDERGSFDFYLPGEDEAASLRPITDVYYLQESVDGAYSGRQKMGKVSCEVETLDAFVEAHHIEKIDIIKIDVEGNEKAVLSGGGGY